MSVTVILGCVVFCVVPLLVAGEILRCAWLEFRRDRIPILLYHRFLSREAVRAGRVPDTEPIYASYDDTFAAQMEHLQRAGCTTLNFDDYLAVRRGERPCPPRPVILTFDDGYESNYTLAWPALRRCGHKATIFVALEPDEYTRRIVTGIDGFLTPEQMREMDGNGVSIESHTLTHCVLGDLDDDRADFELRESRRRLGEMLGRPVRHLAVPRSGYSRRIRRLARAAGYETVCCNNKGSSNGLSDRFALPRIVIERDMGVDDFARALRPRTSIVLRLVGNIKRIPERLFGPHGADTLRAWLLRSPLGPLLVTRRLKRVLAAGALLYLLACAAFVYYLASI